MRLPIKLLVSLTALLILAVWLYAKLNLFWGFEYTSDIFIHTQKTRSFLYGRPLMYDNMYGPHPYHNTFLQLLLAPFVHWWGTLGLIVPSVILLGYAVFQCLSVAMQRSGVPRVVACAMVFAGILGPVGFWMFDHPIYGWHPEPLALPISLLLAVARIRRSTIAICLWTVALILSHELGAVIACCIDLLYFQIVLTPGRSLRSIVLRYAVSGICYGAIFLLGIAVQRAWDPAGSARLDYVLSALKAGERATIESILLMWGWLAVLCFSCCGIFFLVPLRLKALLSSTFFSLPLVLAGTGAGLAYTTTPFENFHNLFWPPRLAFVLGILFAGLLFSAAQLPTGALTKRLKVLLMLVIVASLYGQHTILIRLRGYDMPSQLASALNRQTHSTRYSHTERAFLYCLASRLDERTPVFSTGKLWAPFHKHEIDRYQSHNPYRRLPEVTACDVWSRDPFPYDCTTIQRDAMIGKDYQEYGVDGLRVKFHRKHSRAVKRCLPPKIALP